MDKIKDKKLPYIFLFVIIALQLLRIIYSFSYLKDDCHSDEEWSYGLANSYYEPYIYQDADETGFTHMDEWFSSQVFRDYLTVKENQRFSYDSVFYNQSKDLHPPLYYLILHTICSFFPEKFSFWYGFSINIVCFVILQIFLFRLIEEMTGSKAASVSGCILFGFSSGALNMFVFVRMYAMLTTLAVISTYLHTRIFKTNDFKKYLPGIFFTTLAGCLTHHYFLVYAGTLSACFCFWYLFKKQIKKMIIYAVTLLSTAGLSVLIFPATINHLFGRRGEIIKYSFDWQLKICLNCLFNEILGLRINLFRSPLLFTVLLIILFVILISIPLIFLFRNEKWFKTFIQTLKTTVLTLPEKIRSKLHNFDFMLMFILLVSASTVISASLTISTIHMSTYTDRYLFIAYPAFCTFIVCIIRYIIKWTAGKEKTYVILITALSVTFNILSNTIYPCTYLFEKDNPDFISDISQNSNIIFISDEYWLLTCLTKDTLDAKEIYATMPNKFISTIHNISKPDNENPIYIIVDKSSFSGDSQNNTDSSAQIIHQEMPYRKPDTFFDKPEFEEIIKSTSLCRDINLIGENEIFGREVFIYRLF